MTIANVKVSWSTIWAVVKKGLPILLQSAALVEQNMQANPNNDLPATIAFSVATIALASRSEHPVIAEMFHAVSTLAQANAKS